MVTRDPARLDEMASAASALVATAGPLTAVMTSPTCSPAAAAGDPAVTAAIWAPPEGAGLRLTPRNPWVLVGVVPFFRLSRRGVMRSIGMAKPTFCPSVDTAVFMPITSPLESTRGPPELPGLIGAAVCRRRARRCEPVLLPRLGA